MMDKISTIMIHSHEHFTCRFRRRIPSITNTRANLYVVNLDL